MLASAAMTLQHLSFCCGHSAVINLAIVYHELSLEAGQKLCGHAPTDKLRSLDSLSGLLPSWDNMT